MENNKAIEEEHGIEVRIYNNTEPSWLVNVVEDLIEKVDEMVMDKKIEEDIMEKLKCINKSITINLEIN